MDTANPGSVSRGTRARATLRAFLPVCLALLVSGLLLSLWLTAVSAQHTDYSIEPSMQLPDDSPTISNLPQSDDGASSPHQLLAPLAAGAYDLRITKSKIPTTFTVGTNNRYIINVPRTNTETITSTVIVEDDLPAGMTWTPPTTGKWDCSTSATTKVNCFYLDANPATFDPLNIIVNVASNIADVVTNTAILKNGGFDLSNDTASVRTPIRSADLIIEKTQLPAVVTSTDTLIYYTLVITNNGPSAANNVIITETLPAELQPFSSTNIFSSAQIRPQAHSTLLQIPGQSEPWQKVRERRWF